MPRGIVLARITTDWDQALQAVKHVQADQSLSALAGGVVESWGPCMGAADIAVIVYGVSVESIRRVAAAIRDRLNEVSDKPNTLTSTIVFSTPSEVQEAPASLVGGFGANTALGVLANEARLAAVVDSYLAETLEGSVGPFRTWMKGGTIPAVQPLASFLESVRSALPTQGRLAQLANNNPQ